MPKYHTVDPGHLEEETKNNNSHISQEDNKIKQSALSPSEMIAKLKRTQRTE